MNKMTKVVKEKREGQKLKAVTNFMGGTSYELSALDSLKMVTASSIFGEPQYYRAGEFAEKGVWDGIYRINSLVTDTILDDKYAGMKTSEIMERLIDEALDFDFEATIRWAAELRLDYFMRLNPQVIMVRASIHQNREEFTTKKPGVFNEINQLVMSRADEPSIQFTYWLYREKSKNNIPSILKRSWKARIEKMDRYQMGKYKSAGVGLIDTIRIAHAKGELVDELMSSGTVKMNEDKTTWNVLRSSGKSWREIIETLGRLPHMALVRNLRNIFTEIENLDLCKKLMEELKAGVKGGKQFPFRYYTARQIIESSNVFHKSVILDALEECIDIARENFPKLKGKTMCLSDNSGSAWGAFNSEYGSVTVADIDNLSSVITAQNSDEGYVGVFGDRLEIVPVSKRNGALTQTKQIAEKGRNIGGGTENGIWIFFKNAIEKKEHWDNIFIYSDQQAGHGGLFGINPDEYKKYIVPSGSYGRHIDVLKLIEEYRRKVNPKVNVHTVQTAGYTNALVPEMKYRTNVLYGWTGKEAAFAEKMNTFWDEVDNKNK
jgi:hypothetical protein